MPFEHVTFDKFNDHIACVHRTTVMSYQYLFPGVAVIMYTNSTKKNTNRFIVHQLYSFRLFTSMNITLAIVRFIVAVVVVNILFQQRHDA